MAITIPRAEIDAIANRHRVNYDLSSDPGIEWVRRMSAWLRSDLDPNDSDPITKGLLAEANDLDALADRYEQRASA